MGGQTVLEVARQADTKQAPFTLADPDRMDKQFKDAWIGSWGYYARGEWKTYQVDEAPKPEFNAVGAFSKAFKVSARQSQVSVPNPTLVEFRFEPEVQWHTEPCARVALLCPIWVDKPAF